MNNAIHDAFINALLAEASYVEGLLPGDTDLTQKLANELTAPLAGYADAHFIVVNQFTDHSGSGFSATVFRDTSNAQTYIAFRGTEIALNDFLTDANAVLFSGLAQGQVISMVNWYLRAITAQGVPVIQISDSTHADSSGLPAFFTFTGTGDGTLQGSGPLTLTGHSLGGHLATVFARLFPETVAHANTFNGLGVGRLLPDSTFTLIEKALGLGATSYSTLNGESNYFAEHGINVATNSLWLSEVGTRIPLFNEESTAFPNHRMYKITDALALCDVMGAVDSNLTLADAAKILDAASATANLSLERVLDALRRLFRSTDLAPTQLGDAPDAAASRVDFHTKLSALRGLLENDPILRGRIISLVGKASGDQITLASSDISYRYALKELNPFAILGNNDLYTPHNQNGELNFYVDASSTPAGMTTQYLTDRATMLAFANIVNTNDTNSFASDQVNDQVRYTDSAIGVDGKRKADFVVFLPGGQANFNGPNTRIVAFGTDSTDVLTGRDNNDRLYGGLGTDFLQGGAGDDYLEGGAGMDVYNFGAQKNFVTANTNDGNDTILDTDGKGVLRYTFTDSGLTSTRPTGSGLAIQHFEF